MTREERRKLRKDLAAGISAKGDTAAKAVREAIDEGAETPSLHQLTELLLEHGCVARAEVETHV